MHVVRKSSFGGLHMHNEPLVTSSPPIELHTTVAPTPASAQSLSAADTAYETMRSRILDGDVAGGSMLSEASIAAELGVSRTPVREAFLRLQAEGWLQLYPKRGALVLEAGPHEREDLVAARLLIESNAVQEVVAREGSRIALVERLRAILEVQRTAAQQQDLNAIAHADLEFHVAIVEAGGNRLLLQFFTSLGDRQRRMTSRSLWRRVERVESVIAEHRLLCDLIEAGDAKAFSDALTDHIRHTHRELLS